MSVKRFLLVLCVCLIAVLGISGTAQAASPEAHFTFSSGTITDYIGPGGAVEIPSTIGGVQVQHIADNAFVEEESITSIVLPEGLLTIGYGAFYRCSSITTIIVPSSVTSVGNYAFGSISHITFKNPNTIIYDSASVTKVGAFIYGYATSTAKDHATKYSRTFRTLVEGVSLNKETTTIYGSSETLVATVTPSTAYTKTVTWTSSNPSVATVNSSGAVTPKSQGTTVITVTTNDGGYTDSCTVTIPEFAINASGQITKYYGSGGSVVIPGTINGITVKSIGQSVFYNNTAITSIEMADSITHINSLAFSGCTNLSSVDLSETLQVLGYGVFIGCNKLTSITIPNTVTSMGDGEDSPFGSSNGYLTTVILEDGMTTIPNCAFSGCTKLANITIPDSVTTIDYAAFYDCSSLKSIHIPASVTNIKSAAFFGCSSLSTAFIYNPSAVIFDNGYTFPTKTAIIGHDVSTARSYASSYSRSFYSFVTGITLNKESTTLAAGQTENLLPTINPTDAYDKTITWESTNTNVATVDQNGLITAVGDGTATIYARTVTLGTPSYTASCTVTVQKEIASITVTPSTIELYLMKTQSLQAFANYTDGSSPEITSSAIWSTSDDAVACIVSPGVMRTRGPGTATITATYEGVSGSTIVTVLDDPVTITISPDSATLNIGESVILSVIVGYPDGTTLDITSQCVWTVANTAKATVTGSTVTGREAGMTTVRAKYYNDFSISSFITIRNNRENDFTPGGTGDININVPAPGTRDPIAVGQTGEISITPGQSGNWVAITPGQSGSIIVVCGDAASWSPISQGTPGVVNVQTGQTITWTPANQGQQGTVNISLPNSSNRQIIEQGKQGQVNITY